MERQQNLFRGIVLDVLTMKVYRLALFGGLLWAFANLSACSTTTYLLDAGVGQWRIMNRARPLEEILKRPSLDPKTKQGIELVGKAKQFAIHRLLLKATANYNTYVELDYPYASYVVTAAHPFHLEPKTWHFPIVGTIPYIGFFNPKKAERYAERLRSEAEFAYEVDGQRIPPDVYVRGASAYSTLGWLPDPLYSSMLNASPRRIIETVIHESVHATIFIGSNMDFNERLANFVGLEGSLLYLKETFGENSPELIQGQIDVVSEKIFARFIDATITRFRNDVESNADKGIAALRTAKQVFYAGLEDLYKQIYFAEAKRWPRLKLPPPKPNFSRWNNAVLAGHRTYNADLSNFEALLRICGGSIQTFMRFLVKEYNAHERDFAADPDKHLHSLVAADRCL